MPGPIPGAGHSAINKADRSGHCLSSAGNGHAAPRREGALAFILGKARCPPQESYGIKDGTVCGLKVLNLAFCTVSEYLKVDL